MITTYKVSLKDMPNINRPLFAMKHFWALDFVRSWNLNCLILFYWQSLTQQFVPMV